MAWQGVSLLFISPLKNLLRLQGRSLWFSVLLWLMFVAPAQAALELRVAVQDGVNRLKIGASTPALIRDGSGQVVGELSGMNAFYASNQSDKLALGQWQANELWIEPTQEGYVWIGDRWYRGRTRLVLDNDGISAINYVELEEYLYSVVGGEMIPNWPLEALKAQAVAARSYALHKRSQAGKRLYDLDSTTSSQVYGGLNTETRSTHLAVQSTTGQVLTYQGNVILAVFHSSSGGHTENAEDVWSQRLPYLQGVVDYDQQAPVFQWTKTVSNHELNRLLGENIGQIVAVAPEDTTPLGRVVSLKVVGDRATKQISGTQFRKALDLRSTLFTVTNVDNNFYIYGRGFGHGVGLSQWGAYYLAQNGINYQQILSHYYQGAQLSAI